jgi:tetratricopeptide (TPR) repeat protein
MFERSMKSALASAILPCLLLSACASAGRGPAKRASVESRKSLAAGDYGKALDGFAEARKKDPKNKELTANYLRTVEHIKEAADNARSQRDYAQAGGIYRILFDRYDDFGDFATKLTFKRTQLGTALKECRIATVDNPATQAMKAGSFTKANDIFQAALKERPADVDLADKYRGMLREIKAIGDRAFAAREFSKAGTVNTFLLQSYPSYEGLKPPVAFTREALREAVSACRESLTQTGLEEYRKGNLAKAIAAWEGLLAFDPDNAEIRKAVETAKTQVDAIKKQK